MRSNAPLPIVLDDSMSVTLDRFEEKFIPEPNSGCWIWLASLDASGYARFGLHGTSRKASRVSYLLYKGENPGTSHVLHRCDNPSCVNPGHLYLGTPLDNAGDKKRRGRMPDVSGIRNPNHGTRNHTSKLTVDDVVMIRRLSRTVGGSELARRFHISPTTISQIVNRKRWAWFNPGPEVYRNVVATEGSKS